MEDIRRFREVLRLFERELEIQNNSSCCCNVTLAQCHALMELSKVDKLSLQELSDKLYLDKSTVSRTIYSLVKKKLVNRTVPEENRRITELSLTKEGIDICKVINSGNNKYFKEILSVIPGAQLEKFIKNFELIAKKMIMVNRSLDI